MSKLNDFESEDLMFENNVREISDKCSENSYERHIISVLVCNEFGVLARVAGLFSGRGYNIESLSVAETIEPDISRMTIVTAAPRNIIEQIIKQLRKLIPVLRVNDLTDKEFVAKEMVLLKVKATKSLKDDIHRYIDIFRARIVDVSPESYIIELTGDKEKIDKFIELMRNIGIMEISKTGVVALQRGKVVLDHNKIK